MQTFELLHEKVQKYIYKQNWEAFRTIQDDAIQFILKDKGNLLICAPTASGKTEAAFLPIVSSTLSENQTSFSALYISPLKALINDQFRRIDELCKDVNMPVTKWHGDVNQNIKTKILLNPRGILLITPESLEAMLMRKPQQMRNAFAHLKYIVIDEIHSFVGVERGAQLFSLLNRLQSESGSNPRRIALSATIGNPSDVAKWLSPNDPFKIIQDEHWEEDSGVEGLIKGFVLDADTDKKSDSLFNPQVIETLYLDFIEGKNLIFGNSKKKLEEIGFATKELAEKRKSNTEYLIHHGSLSKEIRELTEDELKNSNRPVSVFCTSTLEMGIDIGKIEKIGIIDPPWSVSGFAQRVGRSGRRSGVPKRFEFLVMQYEINKDSNLSELIREDLVKSIAIVLLYLEGFKEPLIGSKHHFSTLVHQIMSYCGQKMGASIDDIYKVIVQGSFRGAISKDILKSLIDHLVTREMLFYDGSGLVVPGRIGEKFIDRFEFYAVFQTSEQWSIVCDGRLIGQIPIIGTYRVDDHLLLGGKVWIVLEVNDKNKRITVKSAHQAKAPIFNPSFGVTHSAIHKKMFEVYTHDNEIPFLNDQGKTLLEEGRALFRKTVMPTNLSILPLFEGTQIQNTISICLSQLKLGHGITECLIEIPKTSKDKEVLKMVNDYIMKIPDNLSLARQIERKQKYIEKFDSFLPDEMLNQSYSDSYLDVQGAKKWISNIVQSYL